MKLKLSVILSILLSHNLFANDDLITLRGINVGTPSEEIESILAKRGLKCFYSKDDRNEKLDYCETKSSQDQNIIYFEFGTTEFKGLGGRSNKVFTLDKIEFECAVLNSCGRGTMLVDLLIAEFKLIKMSESDIEEYRVYTGSGLVCDVCVRNPNNNDILEYETEYEKVNIYRYKYESDKLKKIKELEKEIKELETNPFTID